MKVPDEMFSDGYYWDGVRMAVLEAYGHVCIRCGLDADEVHHICPRHYGGTNHPRNLIPLCKGCHDEIHRRIENDVRQVFGKVTTPFLSCMKQMTLEVGE